MMPLPASVRVHVASQPCDFRKQIDGLAGLVRDGLGRDPQNGDLFVFRNRRGDMLKVLFFDQQGYCLFLKRLERGTFRVQFDVSEASSHFMTSAQLGELLRGVPIRIRCDKGLETAA